MAEARAEIRRELQQAQVERAQIQGRLADARIGDRGDLRSELRDVDRKIEKLEEALGKLESKLGTVEGPQTFPGTTPPPSFPDFPRSNADPFNPAPMVISVVAVLFVGFPIAMALARLIWKRTTSAPPQAATMEQTRRFDRLEQSVDAIAIEVERISENQRYLTKLLAEPKQSAKIGS